MQAVGADRPLRSVQREDWNSLLELEAAGRSHGLVGRPSWHSEPLGALVHRSERAEARIIISLGLSSQRQGLYRWSPGTS